MNRRDNRVAQAAGLCSVREIDAENWCAQIGAAIAATCCGGSRVGVSSSNLFGTARTDVLDKWGPEIKRAAFPEK
jgi:hypothetical protein